MELIIGIIGSVVEGVISTLPTKKNKRIRENISLLNKEPWFLKLVNEHNIAYRVKSSVRKILADVNYEEIATDNQQLIQFREELEQALKK